MTHLSAHQLHSWLADAGRARPLLLDVREPWEFAHCHIPGSLHVPMGEVPAALGGLDPAAEVVVICHHGIRSLYVARYLEQAGFRQVFNLDGGVDQWARQVDPHMAVY